MSTHDVSPGVPLEPLRRPVGVWVVSLAYGTLSILNLIALPLWISGRLGNPPEEWQRIVTAGPVGWAAVGVSLALLIAFSVSFFRLRRVAVSVLGAAIVWSVGVASIRWLGAGPPRSLYQPVLATALLLGVFVYARRLRGRGVLR